jgi:hypothetical protein
MALPLYDVNYIAIILLTFVHILIGYFWYSPFLFGNAWLDSIGMKKEDSKKMHNKYMAKKMILALIVGFVLINMLAQSIAGVSEIDSVYESIELGFWLWLGFIATTMMATVLWEGKPWRYYWTNSLYWLVSMIVSSIILFYW